MDKVTLTTKVSNPIAKQLGAKGYAISDILQVGLQLFLSLSKEEQDNLIWQHTKRKQKVRALSRMSGRANQYPPLKPEDEDL